MRLHHIEETSCSGHIELIARQHNVHMHRELLQVQLEQ